MRTTVTLDADVERALRASIRERGISFKQALNDALRNGLIQKKSGPARRFSQKTYDMGEPQIRLDKALAIADAMEDEELIRKMLVGK